MVKGPSRLGESFAERFGVFRLVASSHTFWPGSKGVKFSVVCLIIRFRASSIAAAASFRCWASSDSLLCTDGIGEWEKMVSGMAIGSNPYRSWKGVCFVADRTFALCANSRVGMCSDQVSGWAEQ